MKLEKPNPLSAEFVYLFICATNYNPLVLCFFPRSNFSVVNSHKRLNRGADSFSPERGERLGKLSIRESCNRKELCSGNEGDLVYCDLPEPGRSLENGETFGEIESVKAVADLNAPVACTVIEANVAIEEHLEILSRDPFAEGWMIKVQPKSKGFEGLDLMDAAAYEEHLAALEH